MTNLIEADMPIILTDQQACTPPNPRKNPDAHLVHEAVAGTPELEDTAGGAGSNSWYRRRRSPRSSPPNVPPAAVTYRDRLWPRTGCGIATAGQRRADRHPADAHLRWPARTVAGRSSALRGSVVRSDAGAVQALQKDGVSLLPVGGAEVLGRNSCAARWSAAAPGRQNRRGLINYQRR